MNNVVTKFKIFESTFYLNNESSVFEDLEEEFAPISIMKNIEFVFAPATLKDLPSDMEGEPVPVKRENPFTREELIAMFRELKHTDYQEVLGGDTKEPRPPSDWEELEAYEEKLKSWNIKNNKRAEPYFLKSHNYDVYYNTYTGISEQGVDDREYYRDSAMGSTNGLKIHDDFMKNMAYSGSQFFLISQGEKNEIAILNEVLPFKLNPGDVPLDRVLQILPDLLLKKSNESNSEREFMKILRILEEYPKLASLEIIKNFKRLKPLVFLKMLDSIKISRPDLYQTVKNEDDDLFDAGDMLRTWGH